MRNRKGDYLALSADTGFTAGSSFQKYSELKKLVDSKSKEDIERTIARTHADGKARSQAQLRKAYLDHYHLPDPQSEADNDAEPTKPKGKSAKATPDGDPIKWAEEAEAALANVPDTHPLKKKWAANVRNNLKSESDRAAVLEAIKSAADRADRYQEQYAEKPATTPERPQFSDNKLFTADKVAAARARLKEKMGRLSSGLDPEILLDGMIIAGAYIEAGVRDFRAYAKAMTEDFGGNIKPYLLSFWEGARNYPGLDTEGMTSVEESAKAHSAIQNEQAEQADATTTPDSATAAGPLTGKDGTPKWFGSQEKAAAHLDRNDLAGQYQPTLVDGQWQLHPRQSGVNGDTVKVSNNQPEGTENVESKQTSTQSGQGDGNGRAAVRDDGKKALANVAAGEGRSPESSRDAGAGVADGRETGVQSGRGADGAGVSTARSGRGRAGGVRNAATGNRSGNGTLGAGRGSNVGSQVSQDEDGRVTASGAPAGAPNIPAANFQITADTHLGQGGEVQKFNDNLAAIRTLKKIEAEHRRATPEEQAVLARYVGWGGLANAFPDPTSGQFKDKWQARGDELRALLTDDEYKAARRSTRNAHYTAENVVSAMWKAVERLGFKGGLVLESSVGVGNFLGLAPSHLPARFIGVEYDSLTARLASALYPQATVLHAGFQQVPVSDDAFALNIGNPPFGSESLRFQFKPELQGVSIHNQFFRAGMDALRPGGIQAMVVSRYLMDAKDKASRLALARQAKLVGLIRLPDTAFKENARTEVVTDIVILQKLTADEQREMNEAVSAYLTPAQKNQSKEMDRQALAAKVPGWVETTEIPDPIGGEVMTVNAHFRAHPEDVLGRLERSGSMGHGVDMTVRLDNPAELAGLLDKAVARLPQNIQDFSAEALENTESRFKSMSDALRIALARQEPGHVSLESDGKLYRVIERETPEGGYELLRQEITADSPWSEQLSMDHIGRWYRLEVKTDDDGNVMKIIKDGKPTSRNVYERTIYANDKEIPTSLRLGKSGFERLKAITKLRDLLKRQLVLEVGDAAKAVMEGNRKSLAAAYAEFVAKHGPLNRSVNLRLAMTMPDGGLTTALEVGYQPARSAAQAAKSGLDVQKEIATPAPILRERVVQKYDPATSAENVGDALAITLAESGRVNIGRIAQLLNVDEETAIEQLQEGAAPLVFHDPETQQWETADAYLSGMVKRKLAAATQAGLTKNIAALEKVIPENWGADRVTVQIGATWVPSQVYEEFITHLTGGQAKVNFSALTNAFSVSAKGEARRDSQWGTEDASVEYLLSRLLSSQSVVITKTDINGNSYVDKEATALAGLKSREIVNEFGDWVFQDADRRAKLVDIFNERFNTRVTRQSDGQHLVLPGKVPDAIIKFRRHQLNAVWRGIYERFMLMDHAVGAGKTFTAIARAMERRRMGLSRKPMIVVPNHLVEQWASDVYRLYPAAKVLAAGKKDFEAKRRRRLFGKIATGDWDIVIVPHSSFGFIGIAQETESRYLEQELRDAIAAIEDAWEQAKESGDDTGRRKPFGVKEAERLAEKIQNRMEVVSSGVRDRLLTFEQLGVDDLTIDEAHEFKNLNYSSRLTGVRGMGDKSGSRKANDLYNKVRVLRDSPTGSVTFLTGTPISNSAVEMFTILRYLAADSLEEMGMTHFDAFRTQFVEATPAFEPTESGRLKEVTRLGRTWSNMRSLMDLYYQVADAVSLDDIKRQYAADNKGAPFPVPKVKGGKDRQLVTIQPTQAQVAVLKEIMDGFDSLDSIEDPYERNAERLRLMDRARKVSLDVRAVSNQNSSAEQGGKLQMVSENIKRIYDTTTKDLGTQLVFLDRSVPKAKGDDKIIKEYDALIAERDEALSRDDMGAFQDAVDALEKYDANEIAELREAQTNPWNGYLQIKENLVAMGIPANEIRFVQEANNDEQKAALFDAVKGGKVRVLIGSTPRMGAGTNVQDRLVALHHVDVTWKPSDIEQREGRIIRQGNKLLEKYGPDFEVEILAYATERTVDAKMWDLNATKLRTINGIRKYDGAFSMEFADEEAVGMAEMAALASGNPLLLERVKLESDIGNLELQERAHRRKMYGVQDALATARRRIERNPALIEVARERAAEARRRVAELGKRASQRTVTVEGQQYDNLRDALQATEDAIQLQQDGNEKARYAITIDGQRVTTKEGITDAIGAALGDHHAFEATINGKPTYQRTAAARQIAELLNGVDTSKDGTTVLPLGEMFGYQLEADIDVSTVRGKEKGGSATSSRVKNIRLSLLDNGKTVANSDANEIGAMANLLTQNIRPSVDRLAETISRSANSNEAGHLSDQLEQARRELPELEARVGGAFPKAAELTGKRERLIELVKELEGKAEANPDNVSFSQQGITPGSKPARGMTRKSAELVIDQWLKPLKGAAGVTVKVHATQTELERALGLAPANRVVRRAAFDGGSNTLHIAADTFSDAKRLREILRHEVLAHYGLAKMLGRDGYQDLLGKVMNSKSNPTMKEVWAWVEANYAGEPASVQAEEVIAHLAEMEPSAWQRGWDRVVGWVMKALRAAGLVKDQVSPAEVRTLLAATVRNMGRGNGPFDGGPSGGKGKPRFSKTDGGTVKVDGKNRPTTNSKQEDANPYGGYSGSFVITEDEAVRLGYDIEDIYYSGTYDDLSSGIQRGHLGPHNNTFDGIFASKSERSASSHGDKVQRFVVKNQDAASGRDLDTDESRAYLEGELAGKNLSDEDFEAIYDAVVFDKEIAFDGNYGDLLSVVTGLDEPAEQSWEMQRLRGQAARANGYDVVEMDDEHGVSYLLVGDGVHRLAEPGETPPKGSIRFSQTNAAADAAMDKLNLGPKPDAIDKAKANLNKLRATEKSAIKRWLDRVTKKVNTEVLDALAPIKYAEDAAGITDAADSGYIAARMASGAASTMQATMLYGLPEWQDGVIQRKAGTGEKDALLGIFSDLGTDLHNWLGWMAGHRAEILLAQGRENLLDAGDIAALKGLGQGKEAKFNEAKARWNRLNAATLDLAQEAGLFSKEARDQFESEWYIPFFRETEDGDVLAPYKSKGIANQNAGIKKLKGGEANTNDLLENIFTSTAKLIDASMKNMAAQKTVWNLADTGIIEVIPKPNLMDWRALKNGHNLIMVKMEGEDYMIKVEDPDLYRAMTFFDRQPFGAVVNVAAKAKRLLTAGVTASPEFMLRNFLRDSLSSWAISKDGFKPVIDSIKGVKKTLLMDGTTIDVMFSGASFMGGYVNGNDPEAMADTVRKALRRKGMTPEQIARYEKSLVRNMAQAKGVIANVWEKYNRYGEAFENANREAVYEAAIKAGKSHAQAAFESKDLMDFSMLGASRTMQMLVQVLPFFNARVQGLGKLSRELRDNPVAIAKRAGLITAASLALLLQNWDDERYEELPDWDKDANWHFFIGDAHWRIPKPFEIGVMFGTIPERMVRAMGDKDTGAQFGKAVARAVGDTFAMNPTPQIVKPLIESAFNYDTFRGAPIDGPQDLAVKAEARYNEQTSLLMRELGELAGLSPKKLEHLLIGYTGTMGSYVMATADGFIRASQPGESAAWRADEIPLIKAVYRGTGPAKSTQHMEEFYRMLNEVNELKRTADQYRKEGLKEKARELLDEQGTILKSRSSLSRTQQRVRVLRNKIELIQRDRTLSADDKRQRIDALLAKRNDLVYQAVNKNRVNWE
ncbi:MAG: LPD38 domain-containing protein [Aeromonas sp.]